MKENEKETDDQPEGVRETGRREAEQLRRWDGKGFKLDRGLCRLLMSPPGPRTRS